MEDCKIVELYLKRNESAIKETKEKYDKYCSYIANNILNSEPDTEECVNDTYLAAWNSIPPSAALPQYGSTSESFMDTAIAEFEFLPSRA